MALHYAVFTDGERYAVSFYALDMSLRSIYTRLDSIGLDVVTVGTIAGRLKTSNLEKDVLEDAVLDANQFQNFDLRALHERLQHVDYVEHY